MSAPVIEIEGLTRDFGPVRAVNDLSLEVEAGEVFGFLGPNGAGKTTAIRVLLDLIRPTAGRASVMGFDCQRQSLEVRQRTGYLPGDLNLYQGMTGSELLKFFASLRPGAIDQQYLDSLLERLRLDPSKKVQEYSTGNRQKLGVVQALMHRPEVVILDEPAAGLDPLVKHELWSLVSESAADGRTVFFSSHVLSDVAKICKRVGIIREGTLAAVEEVAKLKERELRVIEVTFAELPPDRLSDLPGVEIVQQENKTVRLQVREGLDGLIKAIAGYQVVDLRTEQASLEEIFLAYYEEAPVEEGGVDEQA
jgi:ABC-2 type transport system ATP-binding protein